MAAVPAMVGWSESLDHNWGITFIRNSGYIHKMLCARNNNLTFTEMRRILTWCEKFVHAVP